MTNHCLLSCLGGVVVFLGPCAATEPAEGADAAPNIATEQILKALKSLPQDDRPFLSRYYDMYGNANNELQTLMIRRFEATNDVCREIDATSLKTHPAYLASLYTVLATVKDPVSIPWLKRSLMGPRRREICDHWLPVWHTFLRGADPSQTRWLTGRDEWSEFFRTWATSETNGPDRLNILRAMQGWLHDPATQGFFALLESKEKTTDEERLLSQLYLRQHGKPFDETKLVAAIARLRRSSSDSGVLPKFASSKILLKYASAVRHEAFLPWLIEVADGEMGGEIEENFMTPQRAIEAITFQPKTAGDPSWKDWYKANGRKGRKVWMKEAASRLASLANADMPAAKAFLSKAVYNWDDPAMLPHMERLASFKGLRSEIAGWINLTYAEAPFIRDRLRPLAVKIRDESGGELEDWARRLMGGWDFLEKDKETWRDYIHLNNSHP
jgi:hypothetical protein